MKKTYIKLNIGCGRDKKKGWVNLDAVSDVEPDVIHDLLNTLPFENYSVSRILAQDILEHFTKEDLYNVVRDLSRVLKIGGKLEARVPNIDEIFDKYQDDKEVRNEFLYGTTIETGVFGAHKVGFTPNFLASIFLENQLKLIKLEKIDTNFHAEFVKIDHQEKIEELVFIIHTLGMGGAESFTSELMIELQKTKIKITAYTTNNDFINHLKLKKISTKKIPIVTDIIGDWKGLVKSFLLLPSALIFYWKILRQHKKTSAIVLVGFPEKILVTPLASFLKIPIVWVEFGPLHSVLNKFFKIPKLGYYFAKQFATKIIVPSKHTLINLISGAHLSLSKLTIIPCGLKKSFIKDSEKSKQKQTLVCVSRLEEGKGQDLLIKSFAKLIKKYPNLELKIVGRGDFLSKLQLLVKKLKIENKVEFCGWVKNAKKELNNATICIFPSMWELEGFGIVTIEAMSLGKPIVGFDRGPTPEIIKHGFNGLLAKAGDIDDLSKKIAILLDDKKLQNQLSLQAKKDFVKKYQIKEISKKYYQEILRAVISNKAKKITNDLINSQI